MQPLFREYHDDDLEKVVHLFDVTAQQGSVFSISECIAALRSDAPAAVAVSSGSIVGVALATISGDRAWVMRLAIDPHRRGEGLVSSVLFELEGLLARRHIRRIGYVLPEEEQLADGLVRAGYARRPTVAYFEKVEAVGPGEALILDVLGGRMLPAGLWSKIAGMRREKDLIERRIILPLAEPERAAAHGVRPPRAIVLFGPPGTGKTTFARGVASRLGWPFVELFPSRMAGDPSGLAGALREAFAMVNDLEHVVLFLDEVEEIAAARDAVRPTVNYGVTNELLKAIPQFRQRATRLLVAATNSVRALDSAFLRPGRFDYVIPVGPPDAEARRAMWAGFTPASEPHVDRLVVASAGLTPADIDHAARTAAQAAFERDVTGGQPVDVPGATIDDYLSALQQTRPTVTSEMVNAFEQDIAEFSRV